MAEGLRERKKQETRIALSWAAVRLAVERGYGNVRIEDIAAEAGVSLRTFRNYFDSKADAIAAREVDRTLRIAEELRARPAGEPLWTAIRVAIEKHFALGEEGHGGRTAPDEKWLAGIRLMMSEPALQGAVLKAHAKAAEDLAAAIADRTGTSGLYPRLVAEVIGATRAVVIAEWLRGDPPRSIAELLSSALDQVEAGLPVPDQPVRE
ncbi:TetR/AcrR family transcriptional regulator [Kribbella sp. NPDC048915]|uniref:TetR/AcrR family transcriptional regulator n=1 Tax=Kribbella sp. NPDC048915 TaxID=3155148 RepID=UPI0033E668DB